MAIQFPNFRSANVPGAVTSAENLKEQKIRNAILGHEQEEIEGAKRTREQIRQARQMFDNAGEAIEQLRNDGNIEAADQLRAMAQQQYQATIDVLENGKEWIDEDNYKQVRADLLRQGVIEPDDMPTEYDGSFFDREIERVKNKLSKISVTSGTPGGGAETTDIVVDDYGEEVLRGEPYDPRSTKAEGAGGKPWEMDASDSNTIGRSVSEFLGATYNPITGTFSGLNREQSQQAQAIKEQASRIYREGGGRLSHEESVTRAIREYGVSVRDLQDARATDPLGIRPNLLNPPQRP